MALGVSVFKSQAHLLPLNLVESLCLTLTRLPRAHPWRDVWTGLLHFNYVFLTRRVCKPPEDDTSQPVSARVTVVFINLSDDF